MRPAVRRPPRIQWKPILAALFGRWLHRVHEPNPDKSLAKGVPTSKNAGMCGRFALRLNPKSLCKIFDVFLVPSVEPRYNIAPTQEILVVRRSSDNNKREMALLRWGLIPHWTKDPKKMRSQLINARSETAAEKPSFRDAFRSRRCLIPADGFYEWQRRGGNKQPYFIGLKDGGVFSFAGLWDEWQGPDGKSIQTCTILTTGPNDVIAPIHDRMPVILDSSAYEKWLDPGVTDHRELEPILTPFDADKMVSYPVSNVVNSPRNDVPECVKPLDDPGELF